MKKIERSQAIEKATNLLGYSPSSIGYLDGFEDGYNFRLEEEGEKSE